MADSIKVFVVTCGECGNKQIWDSATSVKKCGSCNSLVVLRTISYEQLRDVKASMQPEQRIVFSNYMVYTITPEDAEELVRLRRERQKQDKDDVEHRKRERNFAQAKFVNESRQIDEKKASQKAKRKAARKRKGASKKRK